MIEIATASLNNLPYGIASHTENTIPNQILAEIQALRAEVATLREENQDLKERVAALESTEMQDIDRICIDIAQDRQRITKLEEPPEQEHKSYSPKVAAHLNEIVNAIQERERSTKDKAQKWDFISYWEVAELLGVSHRRVSQLADIARKDWRFVITWHPKKKNTKVFKLNPFRNLGSQAQFMDELREKYESEI